MSVDVGCFAIVSGKDHEKKYAAYTACRDAGIKIPAESKEYFGNEDPDPRGKRVNINAKESHRDGYSEMEVSVSELPKGTEKIVFYLSN